MEGVGRCFFIEQDEDEPMGRKGVDDVGVKGGLLGETV